MGISLPTRDPGCPLLFNPFWQCLAVCRCGALLRKWLTDESLFILRTVQNDPRFSIKTSCMFCWEIPELWNTHHCWLGFAFSHQITPCVVIWGPNVWIYFFHPIHVQQKSWIAGSNRDELHKSALTIYMFLTMGLYSSFDLPAYWVCMYKQFRTMTAKIAMVVLFRYLWYRLCCWETLCSSLAPHSFWEIRIPLVPNRSLLTTG